MKAAVFKGPGVMAVETCPDPRPGPGEVLVAVRAVGVCGSDVHGFAGRSGRRAPGLVMGHEIAGEIVERGAGVERPRPGRRVAVLPLVACGRCETCRRGAPHLCPHRHLLGLDLPGAYAEYVVAPAGNCRPVRRGVALAHAALAEPLAVGLHAAAQAGVGWGDTVVVLGAGGIGLCALLACRQRGAAKVYVTDVVPERLTVAEALGGIPARVDGGDPVEWIRSAAGESPRRVIDAVGATATLRQALALIAPGGRVVVVGMGEPEVSLPLYDLITREHVLIGAYAYTPREYARAVTLINRRRVDLTLLVGRTCALADLPDLLPRMVRGEVTAPRVVVGIG